ncbi:uncharacterized protein LOC123896433 [Trifolium pratense]|uniref:uncharacterized protein LOC123896433 n=1 Tax=Trifolium pratense TaxID=57577 RepID=UPI001E69383E|nr:uncharacterized protein LOC123896433 [Trifolium pratense]
MGLVHPYPALPNLETLALRNLFCLEEICHGPIPIHSFTKLKSVEVKGCHKLTNLLWYSLVRDLPQLLEIKISDCRMIKEVIVFQISEVDIEIKKIMFPKLRSLELEHLPSLISFCSIPLTADTQCIPVALIDQKVEMPHLELLKLCNIKSRKLWDDNLPGHSFIQNLTSLTIDKCVSIVYTFSSSVARDLLNLKHLGISNCQWLEEIFLSDGKLGTVSNSVVFPNLETLEISHMEHLKSLWHNELAPNSFCKLKKLKIRSCNKLSNVFPSYVLDKLQNLEKLTVTDCPVLEVEFETQSLQVEGGRQTRLEMQLGTLILENLPKLKHIWSGNPNESFKFQNLCILKVMHCESLNHVFPLSLAKELQHLQAIYIRVCGVESIVARDEMVDTSPKPILIFPELKSLRFRNLTQLQNFYPGLHTLDFPVLRDVDVFHCDKLVLFEPMSLNYQDNVTVDIIPLLSIEKVVSNTSKLILNCKDVTVLCNGQLNDEPIYTVKDLSLRCFHDVSGKFLSGFLQRFINLENLEVTCSSFTEVLLSESFGIGHSETTIKLRRLELRLLPNLKFICREGQLVLQNMEYLYVYVCSTLKNIFPSSVVFENLQKLKVSNCAGLENILKSSTATSLPKLRKLCIYGCEKIEEIVASDDENDASELAFMKLETQLLRKLPRLRSFCKGRHDFKFPLLNRLWVVDCPMMETFSNGVLNVPRLRRVHVHQQDWNEWHWNGDINTTIRKYVSKNGNV